VPGSGVIIIIDEPIVEPEFQTVSLSLTVQVQPDTTDARVHGVVHLLHDRGRTVLVPEQGTGQASCAQGSGELESIETLLRNPRTGDRVQLQITSAEAITAPGRYPMRVTVGAMDVEAILDIRMPGAGRR
jgi:hypothetical protein